MLVVSTHFSLATLRLFAFGLLPRTLGYRLGLAHTLALAGLTLGDRLGFAHTLALAGLTLGGRLGFAHTLAHLHALAGTFRTWDSLAHLHALARLAFALGDGLGTRFCLAIS